MEKYVVLYLESFMSSEDIPFGFICDADDIDHAEEQCMDAYPDCNVVQIVKGDNLQIALDNFYLEY